MEEPQGPSTTCVARSAAGALPTLTVDARTRRLIRGLLDGYTSGGEEDAVFLVLTTRGDGASSVIAAVGRDRLEDEIGDRFTRRFPAAGYLWRRCRASPRADSFAHSLDR
jgi:hypothetical protein